MAKAKLNKILSLFLFQAQKKMLVFSPGEVEKKIIESFLIFN